jgi:hypothetical protein
MTWHDYGYGIQTDNLKSDKTRLESPINIAVADTRTSIINKFPKSKTLDTVNYDTLVETIAECDFGSYDDEQPLASLLAQVIYDIENLSIEYAHNFDGNNFIILTPAYSWAMSDKMKKLKSEDDIEAIFQKCVGILTDQSLDELNYGFKEIWNGE